MSSKYDNLVDLHQAARIAGLQPDSFYRLLVRDNVRNPPPHPVWEAPENRHSSRLWDKQQILEWAEERWEVTPIVFDEEEE